MSLRAQKGSNTSLKIAVQKKNMIPELTGADYK